MPRNTRPGRRPSRIAIVMLALICAIGGHATAAKADEIVVFAAASLKTALDDISAAWTQATGHAAAISLAGSSTLARQIGQGAPADVFISANVQWMDALERDRLIAPDSRRDLLRNSIVLVAHGKKAAPVTIGPGFDLAGLLGDGRLAMAMVASVPAGIYGKAALTSLGVWDSVAAKVAQADNVRAALTLVARGEAPYGIVYATDAAASDNVTVVGTFPSDTHPPIVYPAALVKTAADKPAARDFLSFLASDRARTLFEKQGFVVIARPN